MQHVGRWLAGPSEARHKRATIQKYVGADVLGGTSDGATQRDTRGMAHVV
jgi:hypothetical protein